MSCGCCCTNLLSINVVTRSSVHLCSCRVFCCLRTQTLKPLFQITAHKANTVWLKREVWTQRRIWTDLTQTCTRQNNSRSVYFKAAIFLRSYLPPGRLQLSFQPRLVLAKVLELLRRFISELSGLQAEMGFWGSRIKTVLWFCQDLIPLNPTDHNVMVWPVNHDGLTGIFFAWWQCWCLIPSVSVCQSVVHCTDCKSDCVWARYIKLIWFWHIKTQTQV